MKGEHSFSIINWVKVIHILVFGSFLIGCNSAKLEVCEEMREITLKEVEQLKDTVSQLREMLEAEEIKSEQLSSKYQIVINEMNAIKRSRQAQAQRKTYYKEYSARQDFESYLEFYEPKLKACGTKVFNRIEDDSFILRFESCTENPRYDCCERSRTRFYKISKQDDDGWLVNRQHSMEWSF